MRLTHGVHLAYCTNVHPGESWEATLANLEQYTLAVRDRVSPGRPFAIGLRLGAEAVRTLGDATVLGNFRRWLDRRGCYVFTVNGFPYGRFHGTRVKEQVYRPDWTSPDRLEYTCRLFDILSQLVPEGVEGSVSTVPGSFKAFIHDTAQLAAMRANLWACVEHLDRLAERTGRRFELDLEPEPLCHLETSAEVAEFFVALEADRPGDPRLRRHLGVNYDACHLAVEYEDPAAAVSRFRRAGVRIGKLHLSHALQLDAGARQALRPFADPVYLHQVIERTPDGALRRYPDLADAFAQAEREEPPSGTEWRVHFHIPLHAEPAGLGAGSLRSTADHLAGLLDALGHQPSLCRHLEMETYTWSVLPPELQARNVVDQISDEYRWTLGQLAARGFRPEG